EPNGVALPRGCAGVVGRCGHREERDRVLVGVDVVLGYRDVHRGADDNPRGVGVGDRWLIFLGVVDSNYEHLTLHGGAAESGADRVADDRQRLSAWAERDVEPLTADGGVDTWRVHERRDEEQILAVGVEV